jgi:hypothetical protein
MKMITRVKTAFTGAIAALLFGAGISADTPPAAAQGWHRGGYRFHAGYWYPGYGWGGGYYYGWGAPVAVGLVAGAALAAPAYAYGPVYYGGCYWQNRPVYDSWGNLAGFAPVQACY